MAVALLTYNQERERNEHDLVAMRRAIDNYTLDKQGPPQLLQDLVEARYLHELPIDPITLKRDWVTQIGDIRLNPKGTAHGLYDVHSSSRQLASNGTAFNTW